jgi:DNA-nicking Smr family endonuclease
MRAESLATLRALRAEARRRVRDDDERRRAAHDLFRLATADVVPLAAPLRRGLAPAAPSPVPAQRKRDEQAALAASIATAIDGDALIDSDAALTFARDGVSEATVRDLRRGRWAVQGHLDLHGMSRDEARDAVAGFIAAAARAGQRCVRIVHGKGLGSAGGLPVLKARVRRWLAHCELVLAFAQARGADGGAGAVLVLLSARAGGPR